MFLGKSDQLLGYNKTRFDVLYWANVSCNICLYMSHFKLERKKSTQIVITLGVLYIHYINMEHFYPFDERNINEYS